MMVSVRHTGPRLEDTNNTGQDNSRLALTDFDLALEVGSFSNHVDNVLNRHFCFLINREDDWIDLFVLSKYPDN